jgi:hypothetical protein
MLGRRTPVITVVTFQTPLPLPHRPHLPTPTAALICGRSFFVNQCTKQGGAAPCAGARRASIQRQKQGLQVCSGGGHWHNDCGFCRAAPASYASLLQLRVPRLWRVSAGVARVFRPAAARWTPKATATGAGRKAQDQATPLLDQTVIDGRFWGTVLCTLKNCCFGLGRPGPC